MAKVCKHFEQNRIEGKCHNYFLAHSKGSRAMCRLSEWKKKQAVCPYENIVTGKQIGRASCRERGYVLV